ncbi:hypothetical protein W911_06040 [Hyphomicrobium nitrativorans NL23]|uniref:Rap1a immunity protein domain-containing protein n=1 Tax=Hyphomicrobium nitrativorans NL23 TaxID=1029756 RepID=V5SGM1_9HYPH|nr:hypothetical protein [Hyphomicrobium nitrativorans]AHB50016.1 hypothetical protein W911_06040 [Hyphomicrobium nitrativorans NL23]
MLSRKSLAIASLCTIVCAQAGAAEEALRSSDFLTWSAENQRGFISTAAIAAGVIANLNRAGQAKCIDDWGTKYREGGYQPVIEAMKKLPDFHPMAVTLTVIEKACGEFRYTKATAASP